MMPSIDRDEIASEDPIGRRQRNPLRRRLQRGPAGVINLRVIPQQTHRRDIAAAFESFGDGAHEAEPTFDRDAIHVGRVCRFERRFAAEFLQRLVGRAVGDDDGVFHEEIFKGWSQIG